jgi:hypothetical protein
MLYKDVEELLEPGQHIVGDALTCFPSVLTAVRESGPRHGRRRQNVVLGAVFFRIM